MSELHDPFELPEYIGGDVVPADLWGSAPERGEACRVIEDAIDLHLVGNANPPPAFVIVDALIKAGLLADETGPGSQRFLMENRPRADLIRRVKAYQAEQREVEQILAEALNYPHCDGKFMPVDDTAVTMAMKIRKLIHELPDHLQPKGSR